MTVLAEDTYTDTDGTTLSTHVPTGTTPGTGYVDYGTLGGNRLVINNNRINHNSAAGNDAASLLNKATAYPADYEVSADLVFLSSGIMDSIGLVARGNSVDFACYLLRWESTTAEWILYRSNASAGLTSLGTSAFAFPTAGTTKNLKLRVAGNQISAYVDGVLTIGPVTDATISTAGKPGVFLNASATQSGTTGIVLDNLSVSDVAGGTPLTPQRGCLTMIADRMAKAIMIASAVHTVVGRHELRGATQRTKVALPVVTDVQIKPPPARSRLLAYRLQGAPVKKPRPFPEVVLTRKPLPIAKSVQLPHMLKGAAQRKPRLSPEVALTRVPFPIARVFVGDHVFPIAVASPRIIVDPTTTSVRIPLPEVQSSVLRFVARVRAIMDPVVSAVRTPRPITRTVVLRATLQHPVTGSGAPIVSMIEADQPVTRSFLPRRVLLPPIPPAPSRAQPIVTFGNILRPVTETTVGSPLPRLGTPARSFARPFLALVDTPRPVTESTVSSPRPQLSAAAKSIARPIIALVRSLRPVAKTFIAGARRVTGSRSSRARPLVTRIRLPFPRVESYAGSGIERGTVVPMTLAIAVNTATVSLAVENAQSVALTPENNATVSLTTSE